MAPFVPRAVELLIKIMTKQNLNRNLLENTAITLGRLGLVAPELVAPHLEEFALPWCLSLRNIRDDIEKDSAFRGMCMMIKVNPNGVVKSLVYVCDAIASWYYPADDLKGTLSNDHTFLTDPRRNVPQDFTHVQDWYGCCMGELLQKFP